MSEEVVDLSDESFPAWDEVSYPNLPEPKGTVELPFVCPEPGCGAAYRLPQHLGLHRYHKHQSRSQRSKRKSRASADPVEVQPADPKVQCEVCRLWILRSNLLRHMTRKHEAVAPVVVHTVTAEEITRTAAAMLWPNGVPHGVLEPLLAWNTQTEKFLASIRSSITGE